LALTSSPAALTRVAYSPDGRRLVTAESDDIRVPALAIDDLVGLARSRVTRWWTDDECHKLLHLEQRPAWRPCVRSSDRAMVRTTCRSHHDSRHLTALLPRVIAASGSRWGKVLLVIGAASHRGCRCGSFRVRISARTSAFCPYPHRQPTGIAAMGSRSRASPYRCRSSLHPRSSPSVSLLAEPSLHSGQQS
jgi:hypothetical protein